MPITIIVILIICSLISLVAHITKPNVPLWIAVLFVIVTQMIGVIPVR